MGQVPVAAGLSGSGLVALGAAVVLVVVVVATLVVLVSLLRTLRDLRATAEELRRGTLPLLADLRTTVVRANTELERVDGLLVTAETVSSTVDSASRLAYLAFSDPVVKVMAAGAGGARVARRLRRRPGRPTEG